jgi:hypothetical protein
MVVVGGGVFCRSFGGVIEFEKPDKERRGEWIKGECSLLYLGIIFL